MTLPFSAARAVEGIESNFNEMIRNEKMIHKEKDRDNKEYIRDMQAMLKVRLA